jgi:hypothetical protein
MKGGDKVTGDLKNGDKVTSDKVTSRVERAVRAPVFVTLSLVTRNFDFRHREKR